MRMVTSSGEKNVLMATVPDPPTNRPTREEVQAFLASGSISQLFKDRSPAKTHAQNTPVNEAEVQIAGEANSDRSSAYEKELKDRIILMSKTLNEKDAIIKQQESLAKKQSIYSYSFLRGLRMCVENCARVTDAEAIFRAVFAAHGTDNSHLTQLLDCFMQTLLMWLPVDVHLGGLHYASVQSQVSDAVLFLIFLTRTEALALRVAQKYSIFVWRLMSFLNRPITIEAVNSEHNLPVLLHAAEVQNGLLALLQHIVMHNSSCRVLLYDILTGRQFPGLLVKNKSMNRPSAMKKYQVIILVPILARIAMRSSFIRAVELSLTIMTTVCMQIDLEWARLNGGSSERNSAAVGGEGEHVADPVSSDIKIIRSQFRLAVACVLNPVNVHRLQEQWTHVMCIRTALDAFADVMRMPKPLASFVVMRQENGDPDSEVWQQYEFDDAEKPVDAAVVAPELLDVDELERPASSLMLPVSDDAPAVVSNGVTITPDVETRPPSRLANTSKAPPPSVLITAPRTVLPAKAPMRNLENEREPRVQNLQTNAATTVSSARKRLFYDDFDADSSDAQDNVAIHKTVSAKKPVSNASADVQPHVIAMPPTPVAERATPVDVAPSPPVVPIAAHECAPAAHGFTKPPTVHIAPPLAPANVKPLAQFPLVYRKPIERTMLDARSPTNASISFKNGGGNRMPSQQRDRGSQDIRNFMQPRGSALMSPQRVLENRQKRNAAELGSNDAQPRSPATNASNGATRGSYNSTNSRFGRYSGNLMPQFQSRSGKKRPYKRSREAEVVSPVHVRIGPPRHNPHEPTNNSSPVGFAPFEGFPADVLAGNENDNAAAGWEDDNAWDGCNQEMVENMFADSNSLNNSASSASNAKRNDNQTARPSPSGAAKADVLPHVDSFDMGIENFSSQAASRQMHNSRVSASHAASNDADIYMMSDSAMPASIEKSRTGGPSSILMSRPQPTDFVNDTQHQVQAVNDIAASFSTQQLFGTEQQQTSLRKSFGAAARPALAAQANRNRQQVQQQQVVAVGKRGNVDMNLRQDDGDGSARQQYEPARPIPIDYEVHTVYDINDDGSRSNDIIPVPPLHPPTKTAGTASGPNIERRAPLPGNTGNKPRARDESDDAVEVLMETFNTQDVLPNTIAPPFVAPNNRVSNVRGSGSSGLNRGGGSVRGQG